MTHIAYFKRQAKHLFRDYKTKELSINNLYGSTYYKYAPKYFDIENLLYDCEFNEGDFSLMKAQHVIARILGFYKWTELLKASEAELELAKLLFDNQDKIHIENWRMYIVDVERDNNSTFDPESRIEIFKHVFLGKEVFVSSFPDYR